uniref:oleosin Ara h 10.0102-like n=1 Tax=Erigeron canadensis TaxID=72917 RepID=UPI001CB974E8|nr:oleosin Ara h 10.0102-like [Erigeron canadensis]
MASHISHDRDRDRQQSHQVQVHTIGSQPHGRFDIHGGDKSRFDYQQGGQGPSKSKILAVVALLPIGGALLGLAGITLAGTMIGVAIATPLFILFSPVLVPAILAIGLAVAGFLTSGTFGLTGLSSLSYLVNYLRQLTGSVPEEVDAAKRRLQDLVEYTGQKTKDVGQTIQDKAHDIGSEGQVHGGAKEGRGTRST